MLISTRILIQLLFLIFPVCILAQTTEGLTDLQPGSETIKPYVLDDSGRILKIAASNQPGELLTTLPPQIMKHHPYLSGISDFDSDGRSEVFILWVVSISHDYFTHFQLYRIDSRQVATLILESQIDYSPVQVYFPVVPRGRKINAAIIRGNGAAYWGFYYVIFPDCKQLVELAEGTRLKMEDLDGDGNYELIMLKWRGDDLRCESNLPGLMNGAKVFRLSEGKVVQIWPLTDWIAKGGDRGKTYMVISRFYDIDDDGRSEIVAATDVHGNPRPRLSVYKLRQDHFDQVAYVNIASTYAVTEIVGIRRLKDRKQVVLRLADSQRCGSHNLDEKWWIIAEGFDFKNRNLEQSWINEQINADFNPEGVVKDVDGDGEEEMIFKKWEISPSQPQEFSPILLKGIKDFSFYTSSAEPAAGPGLNGQDQAKVTTALQQLKPGTKTQWEAIYTIANSLDPRIPAACLPMLQSSYTAVQRNAARAIGSRWWQIPQDRLSTYVQALKMNLRSKDEQLVNMTRRAIGLLTRTYDGDMFSRSTSGRWVIYERHGKPCLIDTRNHTENLLGASLEGTFSPSYGNEPLTRSCLWHPEQDMVALSILTFHGPSPLWVWRPAGGVRSFGFPELMVVLKHANIEVSERLAYYYVHFKEWKGTDLDFTVEYIFGEGERSMGYHTALLRWDSSTDTVRFLSDKPL